MRRGAGALAVVYEVATRERPTSLIAHVRSPNTAVL